jgi:hypothetical protein
MVENYTYVRYPVAAGKVALVHEDHVRRAGLSNGVLR